MMIATESVSETEIENENQAEDQPSGNGNRNGNASENENENEIDVTREEILRIVQDTKTKTLLEKEEGIEDPTTDVYDPRIAIAVFF